MRGSDRQEGQVPAHEALESPADKLSFWGHNIDREAGLLTMCPHTVPLLQQVSGDGWRAVRCGPEVVLGVGRIRSWLGDLGRGAV